MSLWFRPLAVAVGLNVLFLLVLLTSAAVRTDLLRSRTLEAFGTGTLSVEDYRPFDSRIGWHQYNDCLILQMISNRAAIWPKAIGPTVYHRENFQEMCGTTLGLVSGSLAPDELESYPYTRYWHGHNALTALLLPVMSLSSVRGLLRAAAYSSVLALGIVAWRTPGGARAVALAAASVGALFWGLPYFAPGLSHGLGDTVVMNNGAEFPTKGIGSSSLPSGRSSLPRLLLMGFSAVAWISAVAITWRHRSVDTMGPVAACLAGALVILAWITLLPTHTANHGYMVRMLIAPIALGWAALVVSRPTK